MRVRSASYRLSRHQMTLLSAAEYLRAFWWMVAVVPLFGVILLIFGNGPMQAVGFFALVWPFTIPARAALISAKASRLFTEGCEVEVNDEGLTFYGPANASKPIRWFVPWSQLRNLAERPGMVIAQLFNWSFAPITREAFSEDSWQEIFATMERRRELRADNPRATAD